MKRPVLAILICVGISLIVAPPVWAGLGIPFGGKILLALPFPSFILDCDTPPGVFLVIMNIGKPPGLFPLVVLPPPSTRTYAYGAFIPGNNTLGSYNPVPALCAFGFPPAITFIPAFQVTQIGTSLIPGK